jgi:integrase
MKIIKSYSAHKKMDVYGYRFDVAGRTYRDNGFPDRESAKEAAARLLEVKQTNYEALTDRPAKKILLGDVVSAYKEKLLAEAEHHIEPHSNRYVARMFEEAADLIGTKKPLIQITGADILKWREYLLERMQPSSAKTLMVRFHGCLSYTKKLRPELARWVIPHFDLPKVIQKKREFQLTEEHLAVLEKYFLAARHTKEWPGGAQHRRYALILLRLGLQTTMRISEMLFLKWKDVDFKNRLIHVYSSKVNRSRVVPMSETAYAIFTELKAEGRETAVFPYTRRADYQNLRRRLKKACKAVGLPYGRDGITFHSTRHTSISTMLNNGVEFHTVMEIAGHRDIKVAEAYWHTVGDNKERAISTLSERQNAEIDESTIEALLSPEDRKLWALMSPETRAKLAGILPSNGVTGTDRGTGETASPELSACVLCRLQSPQRLQNFVLSFRV